MPSADPATDTTAEVRMILGQTGASGEFTADEIAYALAKTADGPTERPYSAAALLARLRLSRMAGSTAVSKEVDGVKVEYSRSSIDDWRKIAESLAELAATMEPGTLIPGVTAAALVLDTGPCADPYFRLGMMDHPGEVAPIPPNACRP